MFTWLDVSGVANLNLEAIYNSFSSPKLDTTAQLTTASRNIVVGNMFRTPTFDTIIHSQWNHFLNCLSRAELRRRGEAPPANSECCHTVMTFRMVINQNRDLRGFNFNSIAIAFPQASELYIVAVLSANH